MTEADGRDRGAGRVVAFAVAIVYVAGWALAPILTGYSKTDLDIFFWPSAQVAAHGHPLTIYAVQATAHYPNANGPIGIVLLVPIALLANLMGWANDVVLRASAVYGMTALFTLLLTWEVLRLTGRGRGVIARLTVVITILLSPALLTSIGDYGHFEQPIELWLAVVAAGAAVRGRSMLSGVAIALAVLTRTTALLYVLPIALVVLSATGKKAALTSFAATLVTIVLGLAPFLATDAPALVHSLFTYRADLPIAGGSLWAAARGGPLQALVQRADGYLIAAAAAALSVAIAWRRRAALRSAYALFGALTVAALCLPALAKTVFAYYFIEPYVFSVVWWLAGPGRPLNWRVVVPLAIIAAAMLARFTSNQLFTTSGLSVGIASSAILLAAGGVVLADLLAVRFPRAGSDYRRRSEAAALTSSSIS